MERTGERLWEEMGGQLEGIASLLEPACAASSAALPLVEAGPSLACVPMLLRCPRSSAARAVAEHVRIKPVPCVPVLTVRAQTTARIGYHAAMFTDCGAGR